MADEASAESSRPGSSPKWPPDPVPMPDATELRLRRIAGRHSRYDGPIVARARGWVSRDGKWHMFAARYLDFGLLTPEHLVFCSTGFFTRRPRRQVLREPLHRIVVVPVGPEPVRTVRIVGDFQRPLLFQLRADEAGLAFARALLEATAPETRAPAPAAPDALASDGVPPGGDQPGAPDPSP